MPEHFRPAPQYPALYGSSALTEVHQPLFLGSQLLHQQMIVAAPEQRAGRCRPAWSDVGGCLAGGLAVAKRHCVHIAAARAEVAHETRYERNCVSIVRDLGQGDLLTDIARGVQHLRLTLSLATVKG